MIGFMSGVTATLVVLGTAGVVLTVGVALYSWTHPNLSSADSSAAPTRP